jgi:hypothetical protein
MTYDFGQNEFTEAAPRSPKRTHATIGGLRFAEPTYVETALPTVPIK